MNERERNRLLDALGKAQVALETARMQVRDLQVQLGDKPVRYRGPAGEPRMTGAWPPLDYSAPSRWPDTSSMVFDPETKRQRIRDNVRFRLEHGSELLPDHGGHLSDFTLDPDFQEAEVEPGKPL
jgi:hypothetical protein